MLLLFSCVLCSVIVSVLLKIARKQSVVLEQAIAVNYVVATSLSLFVLKPAMPDDIAQLPWGLYVALGVLLPSIFVVMGRAVEYAGIVKSDAAQRLSLFLPIIAAVTIFGEVLTSVRVAGIVLAFAALFCLLYKHDIGHKKGGKAAAFLLFGVWIGYGIIDILFKQVAKSGEMFSVNLVVAFVLAGLLMFSYILLCKQRWTIKSIIGGVFLGIFNFFNILFYIKSHQFFSDNPTLVFASVNVGVIALGTLTGTLVFKEKLNRVNAIGLVFAVAAIIVLIYGNRWF